MPLNPAILTELLRRAADEPYGLAIECENPTQLQLRLCNTQREMGQTGNDSMLVAVPNLPNHVFLVQRSLSLD
jgi:hypothetical protein